MLNKRMYIAAGVVLVAVALLATVIVLSRGTSSQVGSATGTTSSTTPSAPSTGTGGPQGQVPNSDASTKTGTTGTTGGGTVSTLRPFRKLPDPGIPAVAAESPAAAGKTLPPLTTAPDPTISALKTGLVPEGAAYTIIMRPYGIGPDLVLGSRLVIRIDSAKPVGSAPENPLIVNANVLALADTTNGGEVTKGGTYNATLTFRSDGTKLLPVLSKATLVK